MIGCWRLCGRIWVFINRFTSGKHPASELKKLFICLQALRRCLYLLVYLVKGLFWCSHKQDFTVFITKCGILFCLVQRYCLYSVCQGSLNNINYFHTFLNHASLSSEVLTTSWAKNSTGVTVSRECAFRYCVCACVNAQYKICGVLPSSYSHHCSGQGFTRALYNTYSLHVCGRWTRYLSVEKNQWSQSQDCIECVEMICSGCV